MLNKNIKSILCVSLASALCATPSYNVDAETINVTAGIQRYMVNLQHTCSVVNGEKEIVKESSESSESSEEIKEEQTEIVIEEPELIENDYSYFEKCPEEYITYFEEASEKYDIDVYLLMSVAYRESNFNANATSKHGAMGVMQMKWCACKEVGVDTPYNAHQNILGGAKLIRKYIDKFGTYELALAAYNQGASQVKNHTVPKSAKSYVKKVMNTYYNSKG